MSLEKLIDGNKVFTSKFRKNQKLYKDLVENGQHPKVLWVGCSDSRVVPEFTVNADAGDLFVIRNIANIVPPQKANESCTNSVLEYAVLHLKVEHIIICGHTGCGGITALVNGTPENSSVTDWLKHAHTAKETAKDSESDSVILETIKQNILLQADNLLTFDYIKQRVKEEKIQIHQWLYDMTSGKISFLDENKKDWFILN